MTLGTIIQQYRREHQMSMDDFAQVSGISKAYISILERNYNPSTKRPAVPSLPTIKAVATAMRMDFDDLLYQLDPDQKVALPSDEKEPTANSADGLSEIKKSVIAKIMLMDDETVAGLDRIADSILLARGQ